MSTISTQNFAFFYGFYTFFALFMKVNRFSFYIELLSREAET